MWKGSESALSAGSRPNSTTFALCCEEMGWGSGLCLQFPRDQDLQGSGWHSNPCLVESLPRILPLTSRKTKHHVEQTETLECGLCRPGPKLSGPAQNSVAGGPWLASGAADPGQAPGPGRLLRSLRRFLAVHSSAPLDHSLSRCTAQGVVERTKGQLSLPGNRCSHMLRWLKGLEDDTAEFSLPPSRNR